MKALKLFLLAAVVLAVIVGLLMLTGNKSGLGGASSDNEELFTELQEEIENDWQDREDWDAELFESTTDRLRQEKDELGNGYRTLLDLVSDYGSALLCQAMMDEFARPECDSNRIESLHADLDAFLERATGYQNDNRVQQMQGVYNLYRNILGASSKRYGLSPSFDYDSGTWRDFSSYSSRILNECNGFSSNVYYPYLKDAQIVINALGNVRNKMDQAKTTFKNELARQIINAYKQHERTDETAEQLNSLHRQFNDKFGRQNDLYNYVLYY